MQLTIVADDRLVIVDGFGLNVDLTGLDPQIHAIQWNAGKGHIEWKPHDEDGNRIYDTKITDVTPYQVFVDRWTTAKAVSEAAAKAAATKAATTPPKPAPTTTTTTKPVNVIAG